MIKAMDNQVDICCFNQVTIRLEILTKYKTDYYVHFLKIVKDFTAKGHVCHNMSGSFTERSFTC